MRQLPRAPGFAGPPIVLATKLDFAIFFNTQWLFYTVA